MFWFDIAILSLLLPVGSFAVPHTRRQGSLDSFIQTESPVALQGTLNNIGSGGSEAQGASAGIVVASPSKSNPDCETYAKYELVLNS